MDPLKTKSVFRYFLPADAFVRVLVRDAGALELRPRPGLNRSLYRRKVIQACCPQFRGELAARIVELCPHDPMAAEDLLYQICVEVNPELDIHSVHIPGESHVEQESAAAEATEEAGPDAWRERIARRSRRLSDRLARQIVGQDEALAAVERAVRKAAAGLGEDDRPLGTFLFVGRTGTGKTELARRLARELYGTPEALVRVDCSEYALAHEYSKLIGAPPGYVGHEQGGYLTEAVRKRPECVVLFDEIEKAHPKLHHLLLQVLDEGRLSDSRGRRVDFGHALVVLTSNAGAHEIQSASRRVGFAGPGALGDDTLREITSSALESSFSPEFLGRIDERVLFRELELRDARLIARRLLAELALRTRRRRLQVAFSPSVASWIAERGFRPETGARELRRVVQREIEAPLAELLLAKRRGRGLLRVSIRGGAPQFRFER